jgi:hypothetical protein
MRCLMTCSEVHHSYLITRKIAKEGKLKLLDHSSKWGYEFKEDLFEKLAETVNSRPNDSLSLTNTLEKCLGAYDYPVSVKLLLQYFAVYLFSISGIY